MSLMFPSGAKVFKVLAFSALAVMLAGLSLFYFSAFKWVTVYVEGEVYRQLTFANSVEEVLSEMGFQLREEDYVYPPREQALQRVTGIALVKAKPYTVVHDGRVTETWAVAAKVADVLVDAGVKWHPQDVILPPLESPPPADKNIAVVRVTTEVIEEEIVLPHASVRVPNNSLYRGQEKIVQAGHDGKMVNTIQLVYHDDEVMESTVLNSEVIREARDTIVEYGTISSISRGGYKIAIKYAVDVRATAYCPGTPGSGCPLDANGHSQCTGPYNKYGRTATGRLAKQGKGTRETPYIIAVDPRVVPLNSLVYLSFKGGSVTTQHGQIIKDGFAIAADTGSAIRGNRIDILFDNHWVAWYFGNRSVRVFVVDKVHAE